MRAFAASMKPWINTTEDAALAALGGGLTLLQ